MLHHENEEKYIKESKERCRLLGMNPNIPRMPQNIMTEDELVIKKESYKEILDVVSFFSNKIIKSLEGTPILVAISDEKGFLLDTLGDKTIEKTMGELGIKQGIQFNEDQMGTNVISLSLKLNKPVQLIGTDHYHTYLHNSACYCVPFHYANNKLIGSISIMTAVILHNPFFLMTLTTVVDSIERELLIRRQNREMSRQQELLYEAEKMQRELLERDLERKNEFITLITHEFRTPINVIYSAIQLIEHIHMNKLSESVKNLIGSIKRNTFRQLRLVNNILDMTKLNSDEFKINLRNIEIVDLTKFILDSVRDYAEQKSISLYFESYIEGRDIVIDNEKYERIILNLLSNAIKFTSEGGSIIVTISEDTENQSLDIAVKDSGIGIHKDKCEIIFEAFGQAENNLSRKAEGSGMGLALVKILTDILQWDIKVESEIDVGSTFTLTIPIIEGLVDERNEDYLDDEKLLNSINVEFSDIYF